jgi:hypothetical protein
MGFGAGSLGLIITGTSTLVSATKEANRLIVNSGGVLTLGDAYSGSTSFDSITVNSGGTLTTSNFSVTVREITVDGTANLGSSTVTVNGWELGSGATLNAGTSTIVCVGPSSPFVTIAATYYRVELTNTGSVTASINAQCTFNRLTLVAPAAAGCRTMVFGANQTITTFVCAGAAANRRIRLKSNITGAQRTLTVTTWSTITDVDFVDISMSSSRSGTRLGNGGNNSNVTFVAPKTVYWNLAGSNASSDTGWATSSGGAPAANNFPLPQDSIVVDNSSAGTGLSFSANFFIGAVTTASRTSAFTLTLSSGVEILGDFTLSSAITFSPAGSVSFIGRSVQTLTSAGKTFGAITCASTTMIVLADALLSTGTLNFQGDFDSSTYSVTGTTFAHEAGAITLSSTTLTLTGTGTILSAGAGAADWGSSEIILSNTTTTARTFAGAGKTYGKLTIGGATGISTLTITGANTFSEIASTKTVAHTIVFPNVTTTTGAWTIVGSVGNVVTLSRTGASGTFTLAKSGGGVVSSNRLSISNSAATPGSTWYAGANSTDGGGNTGWIFTVPPPPPPPSSGNFFQFFV